MLCSVEVNLEGRGETRAKAEQRRARCLILDQDKTHCYVSQFSAFHAISCQKPFGIFFDHLPRALKGRRVFENVTWIIFKYFCHIYISFVKESTLETIWRFLFRFPNICLKKECKNLSSNFLWQYGYLYITKWGSLFCAYDPGPGACRWMYLSPVQVDFKDLSWTLNYN